MRPINTISLWDGSRCERCGGRLPTFPRSDLPQSNATITTDKTAASGLVSAWIVPLHVHVHVHIDIKVLGIYTDMKMYITCT